MPGNLKEITDVGQLLKKWEEEWSTSGYNPLPVLTRMAEIVEAEIETHLKVDPDPFDERHPSRADPNGTLGLVLKLIFKKDNFMDKVTSSLLRSKDIQV